MCYTGLFAWFVVIWLLLVFAVLFYSLVVRFVFFLVGTLLVALTLLTVCYLWFVYGPITLLVYCYVSVGFRRFDLLLAWKHCLWMLAVLFELFVVMLWVLVCLLCCFDVWYVWGLFRVLGLLWILILVFVSGGWLFTLSVFEKLFVVYCCSFCVLDVSFAC